MVGNRDGDRHRVQARLVTTPDSRRRWPIDLEALPGAPRLYLAQGRAAAWEVQASQPHTRHCFIGEAVSGERSALLNIHQTQRPNGVEEQKRLAAQALEPSPELR